MQPPNAAVVLLAAGAGAAVSSSAFIVPPPNRLLPSPITRNTHTRLQHQQQPAPRQQRRRLWARRPGEEPEDELERLVKRLMRGREEEERPDVQEWERRRRLELQQEEEKELWGLAGKWGKRLIANAPVFFLLPFVLGAAVQLSGIAVATAVIVALVVASFSLPVFALAFVVPIAVVLLLGTLAFPIIPFAVFTLAPALAVAPLILFLAWLVLQMGSGPSVIREDSLFNSFGGQWVRLDDDDDDDGVDGVVSGARRRGGRSGEREDQDGVIDVEAEEDTEAEAEAELRRFDERLRRKDGKDGQGRKE